ncbi:MAG: type II toxin-antitoxin system Phd/YefM family antitoxin [Desulfobacterales bacterium]|nr:type II toxin-antitoxin system Phd/YefM family antitoxin [Desulfobacterales bacterium]
MEKINIHTAKTQLSRLIAEKREVIIARYGQPVAKLVPIKQAKQDRKPGSAKGKIRMRDNFFDPLPDDMLDEFYT